jgi:hypothetical protein
MLAKKTRNKNSVAWTRERIIPTERPTLVGVVSANFFRMEGATSSALWILKAVFSDFLDRNRYFSF